MNSQTMRDLDQVNAECNQLKDDNNALLQEVEGLKPISQKGSEAMKEEIKLKDNIVNDYEMVILELSSDISHFSSRNSTSNSGQYIDQIGPTRVRVLPLNIVSRI